MSATVSVRRTYKSFTRTSVKQGASAACKLAGYALTYAVPCLSELIGNNVDSPRYTDCITHHGALPDKRKLQRPTNRTSVTEVQDMDLPELTQSEVDGEPVAIISDDAEEGEWITADARMLVNTEEVA